MPLVLGIDSSLTGTGLCLVDPLADPPTIQVHTVRPPGPKTKTRREYSRRVSAAVEVIDAAMEGVDLIVMEELAYAAKGDTAFVLPWMWGRIIDCAEARDIPLSFANVSQLKKYATGIGNCDKDQVIAKVVRDYPEVAISNNNEADALVLAQIGCRGLGHPIDHPTVKKAEVMAKIVGGTR